MFVQDSLWPWVALRMVPGVRVRLYHTLLRCFGEPSAVLSASERELAAAGVPFQVARAIASSHVREAAERDLELAVRGGARLVTWADGEYPSLLREIHDPPPYLYVRGEFQQRDETAVAIVGSRAASPYGRESAMALARDIAAAGATIVSGLAHGIDGAAHRGAIEAGGRTIAVLGCGVDVNYPREHTELAAAVSERGAVVSEFFMGTPPRPAHFPIRNRIISGLARGVLVVEATERSGSLITARLALEQNRDVFAVPGSITAARSRGVHGLIRKGAKLVTEAVHVLEELHISSPAKAHRESTEVTRRLAPFVPGVSDADTGTERVRNALGDGASDVDDIVWRTGLTPQEVLRILLEMELSGVVEQFPGLEFGLQRESVH